MSTVNVLSAAGRETGTAELPDEIFGVQVNVPLIHQVVVAQLAAAARQRTPRRPAARLAGVAPSRTGRRAPVGLGRVPSALPSSQAGVLSTARSRGITLSARRRR